jgi:anti-sigma factor RsiW
MMGALDGELSGQDRDELETLMRSDPNLRAELERFSRVKEATQSMKLRTPPEEVWDHYMTTVYRRLERGIAWILASIGIVVLVSYGAWSGLREMLADSGLPWFVKAATLAVIVGAVILLVSVIREKLFVWKSDPYKDIKR